MEEKDQREVEGRGGKIPLRFIPQDEKEVGEKSNQRSAKKKQKEQKEEYLFGLYLRMEEKDQREVEGRGGRIPLRFIPQDGKEGGEKSNQKKCQKEVEEIRGRIQLFSLCFSMEEEY